MNELRRVRQEKPSPYRLLLLLLLVMMLRMMSEHGKGKEKML